jgi:pyruvate carboxylase
MSYLMYPREFPEFDLHRKIFGDTSVLPTEVFFYGMKPGQEIAVELDPGKTLIIKFIATGEPESEGTRPVFFELNGSPRTVRVQDKTIKASKETRPKADGDNAAHIGSPMPGKVVQVVVGAGEKVARGQKLLSIEAMKMETSVYSPIAARVKEVLVRPGAVVESRDLLLLLEPAGDTAVIEKA